MEPSARDGKSSSPRSSLGVFEQPLAAADDAADTRALRALNGKCSPKLPRRAVANVKSCGQDMPRATALRNATASTAIIRTSCQGFHQHLSAAYPGTPSVSGAWSIGHPAIRFREWSVVDRHPSTALRFSRDGFDTSIQHLKPRRIRRALKSTW